MSAVQSATLAVFCLLAAAGCTVHHHYSATPQRASVETEDQGSECAPLLPAPEAFQDAEALHGHPHEAAPTESVPSGTSVQEAHVIPHAQLPKFENQGTVLVGLATKSLGAQHFEVWRSSIPPGGSTPLHVHDTEETFILLQGKGKLLFGDSVVEFEAPATVIAPAHVPHQLVNTGEVATDQIVVVGLGSEIKSDQGKVMELPWRR